MILGALPLLIYPFVAVASLMSLAGHTTGREPVMLMAVARRFQITSLLYPVVYLCALITALAIRKRKEVMAARIALIPLLYIALEIPLFTGWIVLDTLSAS